MAFENRSMGISAIAKALTAFNSEVSRISKDANNPYFKMNYATLDNIIDEIRPILTKNGLFIMQFPAGDGTTISLTTRIIHESGEWIESEPLVMKPVKNDPQTIGSCITYARRYSLAAILNLNTGGDDDGNQATHATPPQQSKPSGNKISANQLKVLNSMISRMEKGKGIKAETTIETLKKKQEIGNFDGLVNMSISQASEAIKTLQNVLGEK